MPAGRAARAAKGESVEIINILVVDDDEDMLEFFTNCFKLADYRVVTARSGAEALSMLESFMPELIIADIMMPGIDGPELCREIRSRGFDNIPFIFCSVLGQLPERIRGLKVGADDYIVKPVNCVEVMLKVERLIKRSRRLNELILKVEELKNSGMVSGNLKDIGISFVLQMLNYYAPSEVCLRVSPEGQEPGEIYLREKKIIHAESGSLTGKKAFLRIMSWKEGAFKVERKIWLLESSMSGSVEQCLMEAVSQLDEYRRLRTVLDQRGKNYVIRHTPELYMRGFDQNTAKVLSLIEDHRGLDKVIENSELDDLDTVRIIMELMAMGVVKAAPETKALE